MSANPYDPVTTTDSTQLADDDWGLTLPPLRYKKFSGTSRLKTLCFEIKKHPKCLIISGVVVSLLVLLTIIISVASHHGSEGRQPTGNEPKWRGTNKGVEFYPVPEDGTIVISFEPNSFQKTADQPIEKGLNEQLKPYWTINQVNDSFTNCNGSYSPAAKACRISSSLFGEDCTKAKHYGYFAGQPCVLLQLVLPDDLKIAPITRDSPLWKMEETAAKSNIDYDPDNVRVTCSGTTEEDKKLLQPQAPFKQAIEVYPRAGFPAYIYRPRAASLPHLRPAVMVRLTSLLDKHLVHVTCRVWGELYDFTGRLKSDSIMTTSFAVYINH